MEYILNISDVKVERVGEVVIIRNLNIEERMLKCIAPAIVFALVFAFAFYFQVKWFFLFPVAIFTMLMFIIYIYKNANRKIATFGKGGFRSNSQNLNDIDFYWEYEMHKSGYKYYRCYYGLRLINGNDCVIFELRAQSIPRSQAWKKFAMLSGFGFYYLNSPPRSIDVYPG